MSAKSADALSGLLVGLADWLERVGDGVGDGFLASVSFTLMRGRHHFAHRCALVVGGVGDAVRLLRQAAEGERPLEVYRGRGSRAVAADARVREGGEEAVR